MNRNNYVVRTVSAMNNRKSIRHAGALVILVAAAGCAGTPTDSVPDRSPRWMRDYVTGSRIPRPADRNGEPEGRGSLVTTSPDRLGYLPGVTIRNR